MSVQLTSRQASVLQQMGVGLYRDKQTYYRINLIIENGLAVRKSQWLQDVITCLGLKPNEFIVTESPRLAQRYWFLDQQGDNNDNQLFSISPSSVSTPKQKHDLWIALQQWISPT